VVSPPPNESLLLPLPFGLWSSSVRLSPCLLPLPFLKNIDSVPTHLLRVSFLSSLQAEFLRFTGSLLSFNFRFPCRRPPLSSPSSGPPKYAPRHPLDFLAFFNRGSNFPVRFSSAADANSFSNAPLSSRLLPLTDEQISPLCWMISWNHLFPYRRQK